MKPALDGCEDDWITTATLIRETCREVFGESSGQKMDDEVTWSRKEEGRESIQRRRWVRKKFNSERIQE